MSNSSNTIQCQTESIIKETLSKSNLEKLYIIYQKCLKDDVSNNELIELIEKYLTMKQVKYIDRTGKNIAGNSIKVIGWEHREDLKLTTEEENSGKDEKQICKLMIKPAIRVAGEWLGYGQCIGYCYNPELIEPTIVQVPNNSSKAIPKQSTIINTRPKVPTKNRQSSIIISNQTKHGKKSQF